MSVTVISQCQCDGETPRHSAQWTGQPVVIGFGQRKILVLALLFLISSNANAARIDVDVGGADGFSFSPQSVTVSLNHVVC